MIYVYPEGRFFRDYSVPKSPYTAGGKHLKYVSDFSYEPPDNVRGMNYEDASRRFRDLIREIYLGSKNSLKAMPELCALATIMQQHLNTVAAEEKRAFEAKERAELVRLLSIYGNPS